MSTAPKKIRSIPPKLASASRIRVSTGAQEASLRPLRFATDGGKLYVMIRGDSEHFKRIRNHGQVRLEPCSIFGRLNGPESLGQAYILPEPEWPWARHLLGRKFWLLRVPFLWSEHNVFLEITVTSNP